MVKVISHPGLKRDDGSVDRVRGLLAKIFFFFLLAKNLILVLHITSHETKPIMSGQIFFTSVLLRKILQYESLSSDVRTCYS